MKRWSNWEVTYLKREYTLQLCPIIARYLGRTKSAVYKKAYDIGLTGKPTGIIWDSQMIMKLKNEFPIRFNNELAVDLGVSPRTLIRKARELNIEKESGFLVKRREIITEMATSAHPENLHKGVKGWSVKNSENTRFKKGRPKNPPEVVERVRQSRNKTIQEERIRLKYGLLPKTKLRLKNPLS